MYNLLKSSLNEHTQSLRGNMRVKVEEYATKIARVEGEHTLEVMLELNFNRSLLSVAGKPLNKGYAYMCSFTNLTFIMLLDFRLQQVFTSIVECRS